ncbi:hypothetical protein ICN64_36000, partial [Pseudomonas aeruginosa]
PEKMTAGLSWLVSQRLVDDCDGCLHPSSMLLDLGARIGAQRFELSAPDLQELLIRIEHGCERFHSAKEGAPSELDRELQQVRLSVRQVVTHLRDEHRAATDFIEARYGYSSRFRDRLRDIDSAVKRLGRLSEKLMAFDRDKLSQWCHGDRSLRRLLLTSLYESMDRCKTGIRDLIDRLNQLGTTMRRRNHYRRAAQGVFSWLQDGNSPDLDGILERADAANWVRATRLTNSGYLFPPVEDEKAIQEMLALIQAMPLPKVRKMLLDPLVSREAVKVVPAAPEVEDAPEPFVEPHFHRMLAALKRDLSPQSALAYWTEVAAGGFRSAIWLYALDAYYLKLMADAARVGTIPRFVLSPVLAPPHEGFGNQVVVDLVLRLRNKGERS